MFDNCKLLEDTSLIPGVIDKTRGQKERKRRKEERQRERDGRDEEGLVAFRCRSSDRNDRARRKS